MVTFGYHQKERMMEVTTGGFILIGIVTLIVVVCLYDSDWKRKLLKPR